MISIITATFNSEKYIQETFESLTAQSYKDWEWVVTDDGSSDSTLKLLNQFADLDDRVRVFRLSVNSGAAVARNLSISHALGDFIAFLDSDDVWDSEKLERQIEFMGENINFSFTAYKMIDQSGNFMGRTVDEQNIESINYEDLLRKKVTLGCSTVMLRRRRFGALQMPLLRTGQDYATWLELLKGGESAFLLNSTLSSYRVVPGSISRNKIKKIARQWEIYRQFQNLDFYSSLIYMVYYAWRAVFRK